MTDMLCSPARLAGLLTPRPHAGDFPFLRIHVVDQHSGSLLGETFSAPDGQFALTLPLAGPGGGEFRLPVQVLVLDGAGRQLAQASLEISPGQTAAVALTLSDEAGQPLPAYEEPPAAALVDPASAALLRERVRDFIANGSLPPEAGSALEAALQPLEWVAALEPEARRALAGDAQSAGRLKAALLGWAAHPPADEPLEWLESEPATAPGPADQEVPNRMITSAAGMLPVALAALQAAGDPQEAQRMLDGLAAAVWSRPWLSLLYTAAQTGAPAPMQTLMGGMPGGIPGLPPGGIPGLGQGSPGGPGLPDIPGWPAVPGKKKIGGIRVHPTVADQVPHFRFPINQDITKEERCLVAALAEIARIKRFLPHYKIETLSNPRACPGDLLTLTGQNFGTTGKLLFPGSAKPIDAAQTEQWTDTRIVVRVPPDAAPGVISLSILEQVLHLCDRYFFIYRPGETVPYFHGGIPQILDLLVNGERANSSADPESSVPVWFETSQADGVQAALTVTNGAAVVFQAVGLAGGAHTLSFPTPAAAQPVDLVVRLRVQNACGAAELAYTVTLARQPDLRILQMEVTQAIQTLENTVRLAANRRTLARLYLSNGLSKFSYTGDPTALPGVTGSITLWRGNQQLAVVSPSPAVITSRFFFQPSGRQSLPLSLNFWLPVEHLSGPIRLEMRVWLASPPHGVVTGMHTEDYRSLTLDFQPTNSVRIAVVRLQDDWRMLPAPPLADFYSLLQGARARFPLPDNGWQLFSIPGFETLAINHNLSVKDNWADVLEDLDDIAEDTSNAWNYAWVGVLPAQVDGGPNLALNGTASPGDADRPDYPALVCQTGKPDTFAHELAHVFGYGHAGCPSSGSGIPDNIDASLPQYIEDFGLDLYNMQVFERGSAGEILSYCFANGRWTSIVLWHKMMDLLKV